MSYTCRNLTEYMYINSMNLNYILEKIPSITQVEVKHHIWQYSKKCIE